MSQQRGRVATLIAVLLASALLNGIYADITSGLVTHLKLGEGSGTTIGDASGANHGGTLYGTISTVSPATWQSTGKYSNCVHFNEATNGTVVSSSTATFSGYNPASALLIGAANNRDNNMFYGGALDDIRIYNRALSASDVNELYTYNPSTPPSITTQPASLSVSEGQSATFSIVATGNPAPTYQWRRNGSNISGATSTSYTIASAAMTDSGAAFSCVVSNSGGSVTSNNAVLTVQRNLRRQDSPALVALYNSTGNPNWTNKAKGVST
ncbi:MAG: immunoglobulin domain-containing protein [Chitinispirillaceae bacterium]|nr:immunoglobulin domain-containing protein [Chitinispirillaceae bacterium]